MARVRALPSRGLNLRQVSGTLLCRYLAKGILSSTITAYHFREKRFTQKINQSLCPKKNHLLIILFSLWGRQILLLNTHLRCSQISCPNLLLRSGFSSKTSWTTLPSMNSLQKFSQITKKTEWIPRTCRPSFLCSRRLRNSSKSAKENCHTLTRRAVQSWNKLLRLQKRKYCYLCPACSDMPSKQRKASNKCFCVGRWEKISWLYRLLPGFFSPTRIHKQRNWRQSALNSCTFPTTGFQLLLRVRIGLCSGPSICKKTWLGPWKQLKRL